MKKTILLICYNLGMWGLLGFFATLIFGFIACCFNLTDKIFYISLFVFAITGIIISVICIIRGCKKKNE